MLISNAREMPGSTRRAPLKAARGRAREETRIATERDWLHFENWSGPADLNEQNGSGSSNSNGRGGVNRNAKRTVVSESLVGVEMSHLNGGQQAKDENAENRDHGQRPRLAAYGETSSSAECPQSDLSS